MRRSPIVLTATVAGFAAVYGFQAREPDLPSATAAASAPAATTPRTATTPSAPASPSSGSSGSAPSTGSETATGEVIATRYGNAQVRVTVTGGKIVEVEALQLQGNDPKSVQISSSAEPALRQSALSRQSADVDAVSGATITSASYEASLQSALDKVGFEAPDGTRGSSEIPEVEEHDGPDGGRGGPPAGGFVPG